MKKELIDLIDEGKIMAIIPARGGSKTVPKKNIRLFQGHPMIAYSIAVAKLSKKIDRVVVSTDSEEIAEIASQYGAEVPFLRPAEYAQDHSPDIDFVKHLITWLSVHENKIPEYLVHLRPTTPIRSVDIVDEGICEILQSPNATSLRSGTHCVHPPYKWFVKSESGYLQPLMPGITCDEANMARQEFPEVLIPNSYVDVLKSRFVIKNDLIHGDRMLAYFTKEVPDIDTEEDICKLEIYPNHKKALTRLHNYLESAVNKTL